ncbi:AraC family transcriptional regulator [Domibacillus robiginosus]|uniref:AraC family transcriptional regulator n=1 Tax=Domibacillus robiginosus TaxID=1071054 RepID=UPI00067BA098|nr:AraC family transcriptional regulator [Domibacillus robiginosus]
MNSAELDQYLRSYKDYELAYFNSTNPPLLAFHDDREFIIEDNYEEVSRQVHHLSDKLIMKPDQNITCNQHYRFLKLVPHYHPFIEMIYVYSGTCTQTINGETITMSQGALCILDLNVVHDIKVAGENDIIINILMRKAYFDKTMLGRLSGNSLLTNFFIRALYQEKGYHDYIVLQTSNNRKIDMFMSELMCEFFNKQLCSEEAINSYMLLIFTEILREYEKEQLIQQPNNIKQYNVADILHFMEENYRDVSLVSTAEHFHFHPNYLSKILKKYFGLTFAPLLQEIRLKQASHLLEMHDLPVNRIANEVGFSNIYFFYRIFKEKYGLTPSEYRKKFKAQL